MPKLKSHSGAKKRFKVTGSGKIVRKKSRGRHLLLGKSKPRLRRIKEEAVLSPGFEKRVAKLLPYA